MSGLINRQAAIDAVKDAIISAEQPYAEDALRKLPSAESERKMGEWMLYESRSDTYDLEGVCTWGRAYRCSECGFIHCVIEGFGTYSFCPNCGAKMEETK